MTAMMIGGARWSTVLFLVAWMMISAFTQRSKPTGMNSCISKQTCHDCIQTPSCAWCAMPNFDTRRCFLPYVNTKISEQCPENYTMNPENSMIKIRAKSLTKGTYELEGGMEEGYEWEAGGHQSSSGHFNTEEESGYTDSFNENQAAHSEREAVQLFPQEIYLKLRINEAQRIRIEYAQAEDYPVDLYYLMDLSNSMKDDKQKLSDLGQLLVESMSNITSNFRLGFGSFVDKVVMPYVSIVPKSLQEPCDGCAAPYGYRNHMSLSQNSQKFAQEVREAPVSGNLDAPEGGFDAIMQAIVCRDEIQWREKARKLLLFSTDAGFHFAGDGKLGGIVRPNDGCCHLDPFGRYTESEHQDYPSISQINLKVKENSVNIIWAVTEEQIQIYESLTKHVQGSYAAKLSNDSSNIVDLVREQYNAITSSVELKDAASNYVNIRYFSKCLDGTMSEKNKCSGLKVGNRVEFDAEILVPACPRNRSEWIQKFLIYPVGVNESLTVNLEMICDCQCENGGQEGFEYQSEKCNYHGDLSCGVCVCEDGYFGKNCECGVNDRGEKHYNEFACRPDNTTTVDCSGRGACECNVCKCDERPDESEKIEGTFCECDNFSCDRRFGAICSGHGTCRCGACDCYRGWTGAACNCSTSTDMCFVNGVECSGHGKCECGKCACFDKEENRHSGTICHVCRDCPSRCEEIRPCVLCKLNLTELSEADCERACVGRGIEIEVVEKINIDFDNDERACWGIDDKDCKYHFAYLYNITTNKLQTRLLRARECPPHVYLLNVVLGVVMGVVIVGVAFLLVWKLFTSIHDRREFAKFEKERMMAKWDASENPIYRQATSTFKNPTYSAGGAHMPLRS